MGTEKSKNQGEERRKDSNKGWSWDRRTGIDRRKDDDPNYSGHERRSGRDRRSGLDRRTGTGDKKPDLE